MAGRPGVSGGHNRTHTPASPSHDKSHPPRPYIGGANARGRPPAWTAWCEGQTVDMCHGALLRHLRANGQTGVAADIVQHLAERYWTRNLAAHLLAQWRADLTANPDISEGLMPLEPLWGGTKRTLSDVQRQAALDINAAWRQIERDARQRTPQKSQAQPALVSPLEKLRRRATGK